MDKSLSIKEIENSLQYMQQFLPLKLDEKNKNTSKISVISGYEINVNPEKKKFFQNLQQASLKRNIYLQLIDPMMFASQLKHLCIPKRNSDKMPQISQRDLMRKFEQNGNLHDEIIEASFILQRVDKISHSLALINSISVSNLFDFYIKNFRPQAILMWCQFAWWNRIIKFCCIKNNIKYFFLEFGYLPHTIVFDEEGQMAESHILKNPDKFYESEILENDLYKTKQYLSSSIELKPSRKESEPCFNNSEAQIFFDNVSKGKPNIVYFGQNDPCAGLVPDWGKKSKIHSPIFTGTFDALEFLYLIIDKEKYNFFFKPHPYNYKQQEVYCNEKYGAKLTLIPSSLNIYNCLENTDLSITIVSAVAYLSLMMDTPVLQIGNSPLINSGAVYKEVKNKSNISRIIERAVNEKMTEEMKNKWIRHCSLLLKYHLISNMDINQSFTSRSIDSIFNVIHKRNLCS